MPEVKIKAALEAEADYENALEARKEATFFHTRQWARIVCASFPNLEDHSLVAYLEGTPRAVPLFRWRRLGGMLSTWHSSFPFLYGGPVPATSQAWRWFLEHLRSSAGSVVCIWNPFVRDDPTEKSGEALPIPPAGLELQTERTHIMLLPDSVERYWSEVLTTRKRNDIRRLRKKGVTVETTEDRSLVSTIYGFYMKRMTTWERKPGIVYPLSLYENMLAMGRPAVRLYVARYEGRVIGGTFVTRYNRILHYNAGYMDDDYKALRPNILIQERIIADAIEDGFLLYDMLPSAGIRSVESFKESMGGRPATFVRLTRTSTLHRFAAAARAILRRGG